MTPLKKSKIIVFKGSGKNGKSTFLKIIREIYKDYHSWFDEIDDMAENIRHGTRIVSIKADSEELVNTLRIIKNYPMSVYYLIETNCDLDIEADHKFEFTNIYTANPSPFNINEKKIQFVTPPHSKNAIFSTLVLFKQRQLGFV